VRIYQIGVHFIEIAQQHFAESVKIVERIIGLGNTLIDSVKLKQKRYMFRLLNIGIVEQQVVDRKHRRRKNWRFTIHHSRQLLFEKQSRALVGKHETKIGNLLAVGSIILFGYLS